MARPITFLSDYGDADEFAGVCRAVVAAIAPGARLIDLAHGIPPGDVRRGALALESAVPLAPAGVHLAVVDPGVGTRRRAVAVRSGDEGRVFVGPDNGLLAPALARLGGASQAVEISDSPFRRRPVAPTFHGRDVFAPVAAHLAMGASLAEAGEPIDPDSLIPLRLPEPTVERGRLSAHVLYADRFGNLVLDATPRELAAAGLEEVAACALTVRGERHELLRGATFGDAPAGGLVLYGDSSGRLGIAVNGASAAEALQVSRDEEVAIEPIAQAGPRA